MRKIGVHMNAFIDPKNIATKSGVITSGTQLYQHAKFQSPDKTQTSTASLICNRTSR